MTQRNVVTPDLIRGPASFVIPKESGIPGQARDDVVGVTNIGLTA